MTTLEQIAALANAGFTKAEIMAMATQAPKAEPQEPKKEEPAPKKEEPTPAQAPQPNDRMMDETKKLFDALGMRLDALTGAIQTGNLNSGAGTTEETVDTILASIINPKGGE